MAEPQPVPGTPGPGDRALPPAASASAPSPANDPAPAPLLQTLQGLWRELPGLLNDRIELLSLELERAGRAMAQIVVLLVAVGILGVTVWLVLWLVIVAALMALGLPTTGALLAVLLVNLAAAWLAVARARRLLPLLRLPATRRHLMFSPSTDPPEPEPPLAALQPQSFSHERSASPAAGQPVAP